MNNGAKNAENSKNDKDLEEGRRFNKAHYAIALLIVTAVLLGYMTTLSRGVVPGESADLLKNLSGTQTNLMLRYVVWQKLIEWVASMGGSHFIFLVNVFCAFVSALTVGMLYLVTAKLIGRMIDVDQMEVIVAGNSQGHAFLLSVTAGIFSAVTLAFSAPYWTTATQCNFHSFYLLWLLFAIFLLFRLAETSKLGFFYAFCVVYGAGLAQTSSFLAFAPLCYGYLILILWGNDRLSGRMLIQMALCSLFGWMLLFVNALDFYNSPGYALLGLDGFGDILKRLVRDIVKGVFGSLPKAGWLIVLGTTIAPCLTILLTGRRALNGERDWSFYLLHFVILIVTVAVVLETRISPWQFFNIGLLQIIPYAMMSLTMGYLVAYLCAQALYLLSERGSLPGQKSMIVRYIVILLATALSVYAFVNNRSDANTRQMRFVWTYVDTLLDNLDGRTWLVTNGIFDDVIKLRAQERDIEVNLLDLAKSGHRVTLQMIKPKLKSIRLRNSADIGLFPLVQEWITGDKDVTKDLGLGLYPDLWNVGDYESYPYGLMFVGGGPEKMEELSHQDLKTPYFEILAQFEPVLAEDSESNISLRTEAYKKVVVGQVSFIGNNLGYLLETFGRREEAFEVYSRVHEFDPQNISALLNYATMIQGGMYPERKEEVQAKLEAFQRDLKAPIGIWALSRTFGYVSSPEAFARLGWTWAMTGQSNLALKSLTRALKDIQPEKRSELRSVIADVYLQNNDALASELVYKDILSEDPGDHRALIGLVRINVMNGDVDAAREYLAMAKKSGVPLPRLLLETVALNLMVGDLDQARIVADELATMDSTNTESLTIMCLIYSELYLRAGGNKDAANDALQGMQAAITKLERISGVDSFQVLFMKGRMNMITKNYEESRQNFMKAIRQARPSIIVSVLDSILRMDYALQDKEGAYTHAREILHRDPQHGLANYIMGSLAFDKEDYASAEDFLVRALEFDPQSVHVLNDLAVVLFKLGKMAEAEKFLDRLFEINDQLSNAWDTLGSIRLAKGDITGAGAAIERALLLDDGDLRVHLHMAQVHFRRGELNKAREIVRKLGAGADIFLGDDLRDYEALTQALLERIK